MRVLLPSLGAPGTDREPERQAFTQAEPGIAAVKTLVVVILLHRGASI